MSCLPDLLRKDTREWHRILIIMGVLIISVGLAFRASENLLVLTLAVLIGIGIILVFLRHPPLGLAALVIGSLLIPFGIDTGTNTNINITILLTLILSALWVIDMVVRKRKLQLVSSRPMTPLISFAGVAILAFISGQLPWFSHSQKAPITSQLGGLLIFLISAAVFMLAVHQVQNLHWLQLLTWLFLATGAFVISGLVFPEWGLILYSFIPRGSTGSLFWIWLGVLAFSQALLNRQLRLFWRAALGALVILILYLNTSVGQSWISGWLPLLVGLALIVVLSNPRLVLPIVIAIGWIAILNWRQVVNMIMLGDNPYSLETRLEAWRIIREIINYNPVLGLGPANYRFYTPFFQIGGYYVPFNSHNNYVDIVAQIGLLGLICFLWFAWQTGVLGWRLRNKVPEGGFAYAYIFGVLGGLIGMLVAGMLGDWVLPFVYNLGLRGIRASVLGWLFLGGLVAIEQVQNRNGLNK